MYKILPCIILVFVSLNVIASKENQRGDGKALIGIGHYPIEVKDEHKMSHWAYKISFVLPDSAAFKGGLQVGDVLLSWDGHTLDSVSTAKRSHALRDYLKQYKRIGDSLAIRFLRYRMQVGDSTPVSSLALRNKWLEYLRHPQINKKQNLTLTYHVQTIDKEIILGRRYEDRELPSQEVLLNELSIDGQSSTSIHLVSPLYDFPQTLISTFNLTTDYEDLLDRYEEDEKWQQHFINKRFQYVHRSPFKLLPIVNQYTDVVMRKSHQGVQALLNLFAQQFISSSSLYVDKKARQLLRTPVSDRLQDHLDFIYQVLEKAHHTRERAFHLLSEKDRKILMKALPKVLDRFANSYYIHHNQDHSDGDVLDINKQNQQVLSLLEKVDIQAFFDASKILRQLGDKGWLATLRRNSQEWLQDKARQLEVNGIFGQVIASVHSTYGGIILGSQDNNIYTQPVAVIIDLGGEDKYYGANSPETIPISAVIDWQGDDLYSSAVRYAQGSTLLGASLLIDYAGNDRYYASYYGQGVAIGGVALLIDESGDDRYSGQRFAQGVGFWGVGLLFDKQGNDYYSAWRYAQGVGGVSGIGLLLDLDGRDGYYTTGESRSSYGTVGNFQASSQGFGIGFRGYAPGGTGMLLDGGGEDYYEAGNFSQGTGYFFALGVLRDFGADNDVYSASRYGMGAAAHSAAGVLIEDGGNDHYSGNHIALLGSAWDLSLAAFWDKQGNDSYRKTARGFSIGVAAHNGHSVFLDSGGKDSYRIQLKQLQAPSNDYHGGYSFAFFIDAGGEQDDYQGKFANNSLLYEYNHAFMIDLPIFLDRQTKSQFWEVLQ